MLWVSQVSAQLGGDTKVKSIFFVLPVAVGAIKMHLVRESK